VIPSSRALKQVAVTRQHLDPISSSTSPLTPSTLVGASDIIFTTLSFSLVPPVPQKLNEKIKAGNFIDMSKLLSDHMAVIDNDEATSSTKKKHHNVTNILPRCFALYTSILSWKQPKRVLDLLGYQSLILLASMAYEGDGTLARI